ncbi:hypothetical protein DSM43276_02284 [Mycobacteroides salmoniphilum]|nr:hypothetical protein DSM43276_02284 [Mycobacteroides salmoniphilum]
MDMLILELYRYLASRVCTRNPNILLSERITALAELSLTILAELALAAIVAIRTGRQHNQ